VLRFRSDRAKTRRRLKVGSIAEVRNQTCVVTLEGEFDRANVDKLASEIASCLDSASSVLFDFGAVTFANGGVMSLLHNTLDGLDPSGWLGVARPLPRVEKLFRVSGLAARPNFRIYSTLREALEIVDGEPTNA
jgi:anti-anti-sigma regulatory factor